MRRDHAAWATVLVAASSAAFVGAAQGYAGLTVLGGALLVIAVGLGVWSFVTARTARPRIAAVETMSYEDRDAGVCVCAVMIANESKSGEPTATATDAIAHVEVVKSDASQRAYPFHGIWVDKLSADVPDPDRNTRRRTLAPGGEWHTLALVKKKTGEDLATVIDGSGWNIVKHGYHVLRLTLSWQGPGSPSSFLLHLFVQDYGATAHLWTEGDWRQRVARNGGDAAAYVATLQSRDQTRAEQTEAYQARERFRARRS